MLSGILVQGRLLDFLFISLLSLRILVKAAMFNFCDLKPTRQSISPGVGICPNTDQSEPFPGIWHLD